MKIIIIGIVSAIAAGCSQHISQEQLQTDQQKASYAVGLQVGKQLAPQLNQAELDTDLVLLAMRAVLEDRQADFLMDDAAAQQATEIYQQQLTAKLEAEREEKIIANKAAGEALLASNRIRSDVITLDSGLQYERLAGIPGGTHPALEDTVLAHYHGTLPDGTVVDSSLSRGEPASIPIRLVMPGWQEALQLMSEGEKWRIVIPPELAYGDEGAGQTILPHSTLIFEIELVEVKPRG